MNAAQLPDEVAGLADHLVALPGVVAVTLQDSPPADVHTENGEWVLGVYHQGSFDQGSLSSLEATVSALDVEQLADEAGAITVNLDGLTAVLRLRDLDAVRHWIQEAEQGRFEVDMVPGHLAGRPTYSLAAELALDRVLAGSLEEITTYPDHLADSGASHWRRHAAASLDHAELRAIDGDVSGVLGHLARASVEAAHGRLCEARRWTRNEKEILERAEIRNFNRLLTALNADPVTLLQRVMQARSVLLD
jgi:hypothetical protein